MRYAGGGLILLVLISVGIYLWLEASNAQQVVQQAKPAQQVAMEIAGTGVRDSISLKPVESNGRVTGLEVKSIDAGSPLETMYGLAAGDVIVEVGPFSFKNNDDAELVKAEVLESGARQHTLVVLRKGQRVELENHGAAAKLGGGGGRLPGGNLNPLQGIPTH